MGIISYALTLFNNSEILIKISIILITILFLYTLITLFKIYIEIKNEKNTLLVIKNLLLSDVFKKNIIIFNKNKTNTHKIYTSGIKEFIKSYKKGMTDTTAILTLVKNTMMTEILTKNFNAIKIKTIKIIIKYFIILYSLLSFIYYQKKIYIIYNNLNCINITLTLNEILLPIMISILILVKIKIMENIFANLNFKIYNEQRIFIRNFLIILYHKFYD